MIFPKAVQTIISNYKIAGFIPLDKVLHFLVGMLVTIILRTKKVKISRIMILLITLEVIKEVHDSYTLNSSLLEEFLDFFCTLSYPLLLFIVIKSKQKLQKNILLNKKENSNQK